uniref:Uncharacterized protein n=1 Tax=Utricularia reniformis TaxID=192314 RepID=A0A1Y0B1B5_9LAMI|nr:hypothetical protein AEK19_MT0952 [Utricularia reniformis]ART31178.1 hypothetical protein AEK19_MT0952 [Utricularia reniformis]
MRCSFLSGVDKPFYTVCFPWVLTHGSRCYSLS